MKLAVLFVLAIIAAVLGFVLTDGAESVSQFLFTVFVIWFLYALVSGSRPIC